MASVTSLTAARMLAIEASSIVDGTIDSSGHLILTRHDGTEIDAGSALVAVPDNNLVQYLNPAGFSEATHPSSYPLGYSLMAMNSTETTADWPTFSGKYGSLQTTKYSGNDAVQLWRRLHGSATIPEIWIRGGNNASSWSAWRRLSTSDEIDALDTAIIEINGDISTLESGLSTANANIASNASSVTALTSRVTSLEARVWPTYAIQCGNGTVNTGALTLLGFGADPLSPANGYVRSLNRITVPAPGTYLCTYRYVFNSSVSTGRAFVELTLAALSDYAYSILADTVAFGRVPVGAAENVGVITAQVAVNGGARIGANAFQSSGAARSVDGVLTIQRIG